MLCIPGRSWRRSRLLAGTSRHWTARSGRSPGSRPRRHRGKSARGAQPGQGDEDEPSDRSLRRQVAGGGEGVQAVASELVWRDIAPDVTGFYGPGQQVPDEVAEVLLRAGKVLTPVHERREFGALRVFMHDDRVSLKHGCQPPASALGLVADVGELLEVAGDLAFMPGDQDRLH